MKQTTERIGELFILFQAFLWGLFPVITVLSLKNLSPLISLGVSTFLAACFFAVIISFKRKWQEIKNISAVIDMLWATLFISILYFGFYFLGLRYTSAGNASLIALSEILFSYLFFQVWRKDSLPLPHLVGAVLMISGAVIVLYPNVQTFQIGNLLVLTATIFPPLGNFFHQKARKKISSEMMLFIRSFAGGIVILIFAFFLRTPISALAIQNALPFLAINGFVMLGFSKIFWIEGIHRISVTKANALDSISPLVTLLFAWIFLRNTPTVWQLFSFIPLFFGIILLGRTKQVSKQTKK